MHVGWTLRASDGTPIDNHAYLTPYVLSRFIPAAEGFGERTADLADRTDRAAPSEAPSKITEGMRLSQAFGCVACHSTDGSARVGPTWKGLYGQPVTFVDGSSAVVNEAFIRSRLRPHDDKIVRGFLPKMMPNFAGVVDAAQSDALIEYIRSLR